MLTGAFVVAAAQDTRGVFVIELLGNGKRARYVVRKGHITFLEVQSLISPQLSQPVVRFVAAESG